MKSHENLFFSSAIVSGIHFKIFSTQKGIRNIYLNKKNALSNVKGLTQLHNDDPLMYNVFSELTEYFNLKEKSFQSRLMKLEPTFKNKSGKN